MKKLENQQQHKVEIILLDYDYIMIISIRLWLYQLDYDYIKSHYRVVAVVLSKQEELDADRKAFEQIESMQSRQWNCG